MWRTKSYLCTMYLTIQKLLQHRTLEIWELREYWEIWYESFLKNLEYVVYIWVCYGNSNFCTFVMVQNKAKAAIEKKKQDLFTAWPLNSSKFTVCNPVFRLPTWPFLFIIQRAYPGPSTHVSKFDKKWENRLYYPHYPLRTRTFLMMLLMISPLVPLLGSLIRPCFRFFRITQRERIEAFQWCFIH